MKKPTFTFALALENSIDKLVHSGKTKQNARQEAIWLLENLLQKKQAELVLNPSIVLTPEQQTLLSTWLREIIDGNKPLQYILSSAPFCAIDIVIAPPVHIPRPETEEWCSWLIEKLQPCKNEPLNILDLCTGSGAIALSLAKALPNAHIIGIDINQDCIRCAKKNKIENKITNSKFIQS